MNIGKMNHRLRLLRPVKSVDPVTRQPKVSYVLSSRAWGSYEPLDGKEPFADAQLQGKFDARFEMRWRTDLTVEWRIETLRGKTFDLYSVAPGGMHNREKLIVLGKARSE